MNPANILFSTISTLTGGLISDSQTVLVALLAISMICFGFDRLKDMIEHSIESNRRQSAYNEAKQYKANMDNSHSDVDRDIAKARYRDAIRRAR